MDLDEDEYKHTQAMRKNKTIKKLKAEIEEGTYCITIYGSDIKIISDLIAEHENVEEKIKKLENIIDYDRHYEWEKEIYCVEILKQIKGDKNE